MVSISSSRLNALLSSNFPAIRNRWLLATTGPNRGERPPFYVADHNQELSLREVLVKHDQITDIYTYMRLRGRPHKRMHSLNVGTIRQGYQSWLQPFMTFDKEVYLEGSEARRKIRPRSELIS
jgi:hypothetical protein